MRYRVDSGSRTLDVTVDPGPDGSLRLTLGESTHTFAVGDTHGGLLPVELDGRRRLVGFARMPDGRYQIVCEGRSWVVGVADPQAAGVEGGGDASGGAVRAPIPGMVVTVHVAEGDRVAAGAPLVTLYAMKLENEIRAPFGAVVAELAAAEGRAVEKGELLIRLDRTE